MKKSFPILFSLVLCIASISCNFNKSDNKNINVESHSENHEEDNKIELNQGEKWKANEETTNGILNMQNILATSKPETIADFQDLSTLLNEEKNLIIKKCTMKGSAHDNLHIYLMPLLEQINSLGEIKSNSEGEKIIQEMALHLNDYFNYFE
ncbi:MAG TPA: hypothetical protein VFM70_06950 [Salinimicrobium sp.]|nr:hypothetical protein [Salinimicrobium sp.]